MIVLAFKRYEGQWFNGSRHGVGSYVHQNDDCLFHGTWQDGKRIGPAEVRNKHFRFHTNWMIDKPIGASAFTFNCDTMMTGFMDVGSGIDDGNDNGLQWYADEITKYDQTKLPAAPSINQFTDHIDDELLHEIKKSTDDESDAASSDKSFPVIQ